MFDLFDLTQPAWNRIRNRRRNTVTVNAIVPQKPLPPPHAVVLTRAVAAAARVALAFDGPGRAVVFS